MCTCSAEGLIAFRRTVLAFWRGEALRLRKAEVELHSALHPDVEAIVGGKSLLLFGAMLRRAGFPSADPLVHCLSTGFPLAGDFPETGVLPPTERSALLSVRDLWADADAIRRRVLGACRGSGDAALDSRLFEVTEDEVKKGWLRGPLGSNELKQLGCWIPSRRFAVMQGGKAAPHRRLLMLAGESRVRDD